MYYYSVFVSARSYKGDEALTYQSDRRLVAGNIVLVELRRESVLGIIGKQVSRPSFATKPVQALDLPPLPSALQKLMHWLQQYYAIPAGVALQQIMPNQLAGKRLRETLPALPKSATEQPALPPLTAEQQQALATITEPGTYLLHGETGSGKTRVYRELAERSLASGRSVLILTPEIGLTSQLERTIATQVTSPVIILHSQLTIKARQTAWLQLLTSEEPVVVIGPRSALFSPVPNIGLIIVDEAHDGSYKQDQAPRYDALRVASTLAHLHSATLVLGSATPKVEDYYLAQSKQRPIIRMTQLALGSNGTAAKVTIIDLKDRTQFHGPGHLATPLIKAIKGALERGEQSLLYLNRRGTARLVICEHCGWQASCPRCDIPLIYHADSHHLRCHTCGYQQAVVVSCPDCGQPSILYKLIGTKSIAEEVQHLFPEARIRRFDTDNAKSERLEQHYDAVRAGEVDILIGTQTLTKGLDLPKLTTLGVVVADTSLSLPDFTASERTYQQLRQVLGRIGRGHQSNSQPQAFIQTYQPNNPVIQAAVAGNWELFYNNELTERHKFGFPPFYHLLKLSCRRATSAAAEKAAAQLAKQLADLGLGLIIEGPAPSFHDKVSGKYQWQLTIKAKQRSHLLQVAQLVPNSGWTSDLDPSDLL